MIVIDVDTTAFLLSLPHFLAWERTAKNSSKIQIDTALMNGEMTKHDSDAYHQILEKVSNNLD